MVVGLEVGLEAGARFGAHGGVVFVFVGKGSDVERGEIEKGKDVVEGFLGLVA